MKGLTSKWLIWSVDMEDKYKYVSFLILPIWLFFPCLSKLSLYAVRIWRTVCLSTKRHVWIIWFESIIDLICMVFVLMCQNEHFLKFLLWAIISSVSFRTYIWWQSFLGEMFGRIYVLIHGQWKLFRKAQLTGNYRASFTLI